MSDITMFAFNNSSLSSIPVPCREPLGQPYMQGVSNSFYAVPTPRLITEHPFSFSECLLLLCLHFEQDQLDLLPGKSLKRGILNDNKTRL